jgi:hypothetical protein
MIELLFDKAGLVVEPTMSQLKEARRAYAAARELDPALRRFDESSIRPSGPQWCLPGITEGDSCLVYRATHAVQGMHSRWQTARITDRARGARAYGRADARASGL